jgi:two-component system sensor histidine kinase HydH
MLPSSRGRHDPDRLNAAHNPAIICNLLRLLELVMSGFRLRYIGPVVLIALCLVTLCTVTAVSLLHQQATVTQVLRENVESRRAAVELEECLTDLIALENDSVESVAVLHNRVRLLLPTIRDAADQPEELELYVKLDAAFTEYMSRWKAMPGPGQPGHEASRGEATRWLEAEVLKPCQEFELYNARRIEGSAETHERVLRQLAWGMAGVGGLGGVAGVVLGYGVARGLARSIRRLRIQLRDAAGKLDPKLPEIVLTGEGDFQGLHTDVDRLSERIGQMVETLQQREYEVVRAEQLAAVGQLAAGVGHEIRNPLTSIKMLVQAALEDSAGGLSADDLRVIEAEVRRMERSLQSFLDFARSPKAERRPTDLTALVASVVELVRGRAEKQRVALCVELRRDRLMATVDGEQLRQVLVNLGLNALDAMPTGGTLTIAVGAKRSGPIEIEVADTGPGVPKAILPRLFEPFVSSKETGLGLGLAISRRIVEDHGGTIGAANRAGGGAVFVVTLPAAVRLPALESAHA